jgi:hypothetical protein
VLEDTDAVVNKLLVLKVCVVEGRALDAVKYICPLLLITSTFDTAVEEVTKLLKNMELDATYNLLPDTIRSSKLPDLDINLGIFYFYWVYGIAIHQTMLPPVNAIDELVLIVNDVDDLLCIVHDLESSPVTVTA